MNFIGEIAGLTTAFCWAFTSMFFAEAGKLIGSFKVNKIRLIFAVVIYCFALFITAGRLFPDDLNMRQVYWLSLSGIVGLVFGDGCGFKALVMIGPRLTTLLYSTAPVMATLIAWFFLGEKLNFLNILGIIITIVGVTWVVIERRYKTNNNTLSKDHPDSGSLSKGVLLGLGAAFGQAAGLVLAKQGMLYAGGNVAPMEASFIRMLTALVCIWFLSALRGQFLDTFKVMKNKRAMAFCFGGAFAGPFMGVWMSLIAVALIATGVAATLNAMTPVMIIPLVILYYKEKVSVRAIIGTVIAIGGVALLFIS